MVLVVLSLLALIGVAALVIDYGAVAKEKRVLQNGADAATYAGLNADDGVSNAAACGSGPGLSACASPPAGVSGNYVKVDTTTNGQVTYQFGQAIGAGSGKTVKASAAAQWGVPKTLTVLPLTISKCEVDAAGVPSGVVTLDLQTNKTCAGGVPGGFGWIKDPSSGSSCAMTITEGSVVASDPGASAPACPSASDFAAMLNTVVALPVFSASAGTGNNATYTIAGFVGFKLTCYHVASLSGGTGGCGNKQISGSFQKYVATGGTWGGGNNFGVSVVKLVA
jgi:hypothetical protein